MVDMGRAVRDVVVFFSDGWRAYTSWMALGVAFCLLLLLFVDKFASVGLSVCFFFVVVCLLLHW